MPVRDLLSAASGAGAPADPYFYDVSLLLNGDGTNGAQNNTFLDSSTNNFTITRNGNTTQGSFSPYGSLWSNYFNGSSYLSAPAGSAWAFGTGDFTVETWINTNTTNSQQCITGTYLNSSSGFSFTIETSNNYLKVRTLGDPVVLTGNVTVTPNVWHHVAVVRSSGTITLYLDGTSCGSTSNSDNITSNGVAMYIGQLGNSSGYVNGYLSNVRIVKGTAVYTSNFTPSTTPLTAVSGTQLLTSQSNRFIDNSSNAFAITVNGSPSVQRFSPFNPTAPYDTSVIGGSGYFNSGNSSYLSVPDNAALELGTNSFTMEAWVFPTSFASTYAVLSKMTSSGTASGFLFNVSSSSGLLLFYASSNGSSWDIVSALGSINLALNSWNHIAVGRSGSTFRLWVNGSSSGTATSSGSVENNSASVLIGAAGQSSTANFANSYISNARIVNGTDVYGVSNSTITVPTTPLTAVTNTSLLTNFTNAGIPDLAMQNNLETVGNAQVSTSVKKYGTGSLSFNGSGSELLASSNPAQVLKGDFTIEGWVYLNNTTGLQTIIGRWQTSNQEYLFWVVSGVVQFYFSAFSVAVPLVTASSSLSATTWTHVAVTRSGSTFTVYINGTSAGTATNSSAMTVTTAATTIGSILPSFSGYDLNGYIDDLRVTNGLVRYTANFTPPASALPTY